MLQFNRSSFLPWKVVICFDDNSCSLLCHIWLKRRFFACFSVTESMGPFIKCYILFTATNRLPKVRMKPWFGEPCLLWISQVPILFCYHEANCWSQENRVMHPRGCNFMYFQLSCNLIGKSRSASFSPSWRIIISSKINTCTCNTCQKMGLYCEHDSIKFISLSWCLQVKRTELSFLLKYIWFWTRTFYNEALTSGRCCLCGWRDSRPVCNRDIVQSLRMLTSLLWKIQWTKWIVVHLRDLIGTEWTAFLWVYCS